MRKIIAGLDIGTYTIKLVVGEIQKNKLNVLACNEVYSRGIKNGFVVNPDSASLAFKELFNRTEAMLGLPVKKVIVSVPSYNMTIDKKEASISITNEEKKVTHSDIIKVMQKSIAKDMDDTKELVSILPITFYLNDEEKIANPIGKSATKLAISDVCLSVPKKNVENIINCIEKNDVKVIDIVTSPLADFYEYKDEEMSSRAGVVINIGYSNTTVSVFSKGIIRASDVLDIGSKQVLDDIAYCFKINKKDALLLQDNLTTLDIHMALPSETITVKDIEGHDKKVSEYDVSAVVISRLNEILGLVKKEINHLTNKEISYIMITGGISELECFDQFASEIFPDKYKKIEISEIGARNKKYSVALGMIKYYNSRLKLRNAEFSIFNLDEQEELSSSKRKINVKENSMLAKIFGYFFDN